MNWLQNLLVFLLLWFLGGLAYMRYFDKDMVML